MLRSTLHRIAQNRALGTALARSPLQLERFFGGTSVSDAAAVAEKVANDGFRISMERATGMHDGEPDEVVADTLAMIGALDDRGIATISEVAVFPHSLGLRHDPGQAGEHVRQICDAAAAHGIAVMVGMGDDELVTPTLELVRRLRDSGIDLGVTMQAARRGTQRDCAEFSDGPVRLVKGAYRTQGGDFFTSPIEIDKAYVRCARAMLQGSKNEVSFATHDARIIEIVESLITRYERELREVEFAYFLGRHEGQRDRVLRQGYPVRVYIPFGPQWFERLVDGLAEQPANLTWALRSLLPGA
jgi:proline dehydrogenase